MGMFMRALRFAGLNIIVCGVLSVPCIASAANKAPVISGTPKTSIAVGSHYSFTPASKDSDGDKLKFTIMNRPAWATFSYSTGRLQGKPPKAGKWSNIGIFVSDGKVSKGLRKFSITAAAAARANKSSSKGGLKISGSPVKSVTVGSTYSFAPTPSAAKGKLKFSIANKPSWASFSTSTGKLSGKPGAAHVGTYSNIVINAADSKSKASLASFAINVSAMGTGAATLQWQAPTRNTDGTALRNLAGYRIYYGTNSKALDQVIYIKNASVSTYVVDNLSRATYYFAVKAVNSAGAESSLSNLASKKIN